MITAIENEKRRAKRAPAGAGLIIGVAGLALAALFPAISPIMLPAV